MYARVTQRDTVLALDVTDPIFQKYRDTNYYTIATLPPVTTWYYPIDLKIRESDGEYVVLLTEGGSQIYCCLLDHTDFSRNAGMGEPTLDREEAITYLENVVKVGDTVIFKTNQNREDREGIVYKVSDYVRIKVESGMQYSRGYHEITKLSSGSTGKAGKIRSFNIEELLEILKADKPAEHVLMDLEDYITN